MVDVSLTPDLCSKVFENPLILEKILHFVIYNGVKLSKGDITRCRLVQKKWLQVTSDNLLKIGRPIFFTDFGSFVVWNSKDVMTEGRLSTFLATWGTSFGEGNPVFPFLLFARPSFRISKDAVTKFVNFMVRYGKSVTRMNVQLSNGHMNCNRVQLPKAAAQIRLPNLRWLRVDLTRDEDPTGTAILRHIFEGVEQLDTLTITYNRELDLFRKPNQFKCPKLPPFFKKLHLDVKLYVDQLETLLLGTNLPNLAEITFSAVPMISEGWSELLFKILDRYRLQLKKLTFDQHDQDFDKRSFELKFPVMPKLKNLCVNDQRYYAPENFSGLEQFIPEVHTLSLHCGTVPSLLNWIQNSQLDSVKKLSLELHCPESEIQLDFPIGPQLRSSFCHVVDLVVDMSSPIHPFILQAIFQEMFQLQKLDVRLEAPESRVGHEFWDAIFLGVTTSFVFAMQVSPELWDAVQVDHHRLSKPSIVNLSELNTLTLRSDDNPLSQISDITFRFGFTCMPNLQEINVDFDLQESVHIEKWKTQGGKLKKLDDCYIKDSTNIFL